MATETISGIDYSTHSEGGACFTPGVEKPRGLFDVAQEVEALAGRTVSMDLTNLPKDKLSFDGLRQVWVAATGLNSAFGGELQKDGKVVGAVPFVDKASGSVGVAFPHIQVELPSGLGERTPSVQVAADRLVRSMERNYFYRAMLGNKDVVNWEQALKDHGIGNEAALRERIVEQKQVIAKQMIDVAKVTAGMEAERSAHGLSQIAVGIINKLLPGTAIYAPAPDMTEVQIQQQEAQQKKMARVLSVGTITSTLLTACSPALVAPSSEAPMPAPKELASPVGIQKSQEKTPTAAYEPTLLPTDKAVAGVPAVNPPDFAHDTTNHDASGPLTLRDAYAVYQLSRMVNGKQLFHDDPEFIKAMEVFRNDYMKKNPNITLMRASKDGVVDSGIKRDNGDGTFSMILSFKADGAVAYPEPGYFDPRTTQEWVTFQGDIDMFIGPDKHTYTTVDNKKGEIDSWFKTVGANRDNIDQQLVKVTTADSVPAAGEPAPAANASEGAVKTADGSTVFVEEGKLWQLDAQGQPAEKDILDVTFADVVDSGIIVKQLHPEYYENDQKLLKETLLPEGVAINKRYKLSVDDFVVGSNKDYPGVHDVMAIGYLLNVSRVKWGEESVAVMNFALVGADQPIPVVLGVMENDSQMTSFIERIYFAQVGTDPYGKGLTKDTPREEPPSSLQSFADSYLGSIVEMIIFSHADPEKVGEFYGFDYIKKSSDYSKIINDSATHQMANTGWLIKQEGFKTSGEFLSRVIEESAKNPEKLGPGFVINNNNIVVHKDK